MHFGKTMRYLVCNKYYWTLPVYYDERKHVWFYPKHKVKMYSLGIFLAPPCFTSHCNLQKGISQNRMIISFAAGAKTPPPSWKYCKSRKLQKQQTAEVALTNSCHSSAATHTLHLYIHQHSDIPKWRAKMGEIIKKKCPAYMSLLLAAFWNIEHKLNV